VSEVTRAGIYEGRVAAVTGASRGIGRAIAEHFLANGAAVIGISRGASSLEDKRYLHLSANIGEHEAVREAFREIRLRFGRLDILVNNAAVLTSTHLLLMPPSTVREMVSTNLLGTIFVSTEAARLMCRKKYGRIINIGSIASVLHVAGDSIYAATKEAAVTLCGVLAREWSNFNITLNTVGVTAFPTEMLAQLPEKNLAPVLQSFPIPGLAAMDDILNVIDFFASERSRNITAQSVFLGGVH
jgi:3-oxoacyl-[acyl-carrier protein] reductase